MSEETPVSESEAVCREFAQYHPTKEVLACIGYAEQGRITWEACEGLFQNALAAGLKAIK